MLTPFSLSFKLGRDSYNLTGEVWLKSFILSLFLIFGIAQKSHAGLIIWAAGADDVGKITMATGGAGALLGGALILSEKNSLGAGLGMAIVLTLAASVVVLDEELSVDHIKEAVIKKVPFIDDEDILSEIAAELYAQYNPELIKQEVSLDKTYLQNLLEDAGYDLEEINKAVRAL